MRAEDNDEHQTENRTKESLWTLRDTTNFVRQPIQDLLCYPSPTFLRFIVPSELHYDSLDSLTRRGIGISRICLDQKLKHVQHLRGTEI